MEQADDVASENGRTDLEVLIEAFGDRALGPLLVLIGLLAMSPVGAIPGMPVALSIVIILFAGQFLAGRSSPWLPSMLSRVSIDEDKIHDFRKNAESWLSYLDNFIHRRFDWATGEIARRLAAGLSILLAITMIPLEALPFAVALPAAGITLFGVALTARDGLAMCLGFIASAAVAAGWIWLL